MGVLAEADTERPLTKKEQILASLNEQQKLPVLNYRGPSIVIAGAGSGKSHCVVSRTAYMIEDGVPASQILVFTFTNKAARELQDRVANRIGYKAEAVTVSTYHSFCVRILRQYVEELGLSWNRNFCIYDTDDKNDVLRKILKDQTDDKIKDMKLEPAKVGAKISKWKERMISPQMAQQSNVEYDQIVGLLYEQYQLAMADSNAFDFDDLIYFVIRLFERCPEVLAAINKRYLYITADESQDSSARDLQLIEYLGGTEMNICLVGDDWQSIYGFRGADINAFFEFVEKHHLKQYKLERNYRSTQTIVKAAQSLIEHNPRQFSKNAFSENDKGSSIVRFDAQDPEAEAILATKIAKVYHREYNIPYENMAILYRLSKQARPIEDAFLCNNVPYEKLSGVPFYGLAEIKDIMSYLRLLINPMDSIALQRIINVPARGIGEKSVAKLISACQLDGIYDILSLEDVLNALEQAADTLTAKPKKGVLQFISVMRQLSDAAATLSPAEMIDQVRWLTEYDDYLKKKDAEAYRDRQENIEELRELASDAVSMFDFVNGMALNEKIAYDHQNTDSGVKLMTIHGAKGLEYQLVILIGANEETLPHKFARSEESVAEERRLFYVALTRAKEYMFITRPNMTKVKNVYELATPSRFLDEIDSQYIKRR